MEMSLFVTLMIFHKVV